MQLSGTHTDEIGSGTELAALVHAVAPDADLFAIKVMGDTLRPDPMALEASLDPAP